MSQEISGETVLLDLQSGSCFGLDDLVTRFWLLLQKKKDRLSLYDIML